MAASGTGLGLNPCSRPGEKRARGSVGFAGLLRKPGSERKSDPESGSQLLVLRCMVLLSRPKRNEKLRCSDFDKIAAVICGGLSQILREQWEKKRSCSDDN